MIINKDELSEHIFKSVKILAQLRSEEGCPWDKKQDLKSLKKYLIEETYEVIEAIELNDMRSLKIELGDLLLQIIFQSRIMEEENQFDFLDVIKYLNEKLIRRHPHVFGEDIAENSDDVNLIWERIKTEENDNNFSGDSDILEYNKSQPALLQALELQRKAAEVGFDWEEIEPVFDKIEEELSEIKEALRSESKEAASQELGDLLFATVNLSRFIDTNPEVALLGTINRFIKRFKYIEKKVIEDELDFENMEILELEKLWQEAKLKMRR